jgi:hypothetical protein
MTSWPLAKIPGGPGSPFEPGIWHDRSYSLDFIQGAFTNRRVWTFVFVLSISSLLTVRSAFPQGQTPSQRRAIDPPAKPSDSPVSLGMLVGDRLYISGRVGLDPKTGKVPDNLDDEMKLVHMGLLGSASKPFLEGKIWEELKFTKHLLSCPRASRFEVVVTASRMIQRRDFEW